MSVGVGSTSPDQSTRFNFGKLSAFTRPNCAMYDSTDGVDDQCVMPDDRMNSARLFGSTLTIGGTRCSSAPAANAAKTSITDMSTWSGQWHDTRSEASIAKWVVIHSTALMTLSCVRIAPFGVPLDPDVKKTNPG